VITFGITQMPKINKKINIKIKKERKERKK
jgi:hypothetical protein